MMNTTLPASLRDGLAISELRGAADMMMSYTVHACASPGKRRPIPEKKKSVAIRTTNLLLQPTGVVVAEMLLLPLALWLQVDSYETLFQCSASYMIVPSNERLA